LRGQGKGLERGNWGTCKNRRKKRFGGGDYINIRYSVREDITRVLITIAKANGSLGKALRPSRLGGGLSAELNSLGKKSFGGEVAIK